MSYCHLGSPFASQGSSNSVNTNLERPPVQFQLSTNIQLPSLGRTNLVDAQFKPGQRQPCFSPTSRSNDSLGRFCVRLGRNMSGQIHQWQIVQSEINSTHQLTGTESSISCPKNIPQGPVSHGCTIEDGQLHRSCLHKQQGRYPFSPSDVLNSGDMDLVSSQRHSHFCTACPWKRKYYSRPRVSYLSRFQQLATRPKGNHTLPYKLQHRSVCQSPKAQLPQYISWRPDPGAFHIDTLTLHWNSLKGYAFPHFNLNPVVFNKVIQDNTDLVLVAPIWQAQSW